MRVVKLPTNYYQQFDADYLKEFPGEGYGGWKRKKLELNLDKTAVVLMHAINYGTIEEVPGVFAACEYIPRAYEIGKNVMPSLLKAIRESGMKLFHVAAGPSYCKDYAGYKKTLEIAGEKAKFEQVDPDPVIERLREFKRDFGFPGKHNLESYSVMAKIFAFPEEEKPIGDEEIVVDEKQLFKLCKYYGINHLIYIGYNINWCIQFSSAGFMHLYRHGIMCSTIRQAVTAVENKETARSGFGKEIALWTIAVGFGYVYDIDDFVKAIKDCQISD
jgi:hypothetical protein